jgi:hypothetical protein
MSQRNETLGRRRTIPSSPTAWQPRGWRRRPAGPLCRLRPLTRSAFLADARATTRRARRSSQRATTSKWERHFAASRRSRRFRRTILRRCRVRLRSARSRRRIAAQRSFRKAAAPHIPSGATTPKIGPAQATTKGRGFGETSVREMPRGWSATRVTSPPVPMAPRTWPSSCTACIPHHDAATVETISTTCGHRLTRSLFTEWNRTQKYLPTEGRIEP